MVQLLRDDTATRAAPSRRPGLPTRLVSLGFVALVGFLLVLKVVGLAYREIYPAVIFPGFARLPEGAAETDEEIRIRKIGILSGDRRLELTADEAFPEPFDSFYLPMLDSLIGAEPTPSLQAWAATTWHRQLGEQTCVTGLQVLDVVVADESQHEVVTNLTFPACDRDLGDG